MNGPAFNPASAATMVSAFAQVGKQPVGEETAREKMDLLPPVEQSGETAKQQLRNDAEVGDPQEKNDRQRDADPDKLSEEDQRLIEELAARDREVRAHEQAHASVGGQYAGAPSYQYERGPDGVNYAVSGEVSISTSAVPNDPQATLRKAEVVRAAALAPAQPSSQDRAVAAKAAQMMQQARVEIAVNATESADAKETDKAQQEVSSVESKTRPVYAFATPQAIASQSGSIINNQA